MSLILSLFPGFGLLDRAFEEEGFTVVRGPDLLWGGDVRTFHVPAGRFDGVIGGPPCQVFSQAAAIGGRRSGASDLIPEFLRIVQEAQPRFVVMENVLTTLRKARVPREWYPCKLRDWDCGGRTHRRRIFYTWPFMVMAPTKRPGTPSHSVLASTAKRGADANIEFRTGRARSLLIGNLPLTHYVQLQGLEQSDVAELERIKTPRQVIVHMIGNGVPLAMGRWIARATREATQ